MLSRTDRLREACVDSLADADITNETTKLGLFKQGPLRQIVEENAKELIAQLVDAFPERQFDENDLAAAQQLNTHLHQMTQDLIHFLNHEYEWGNNDPNKKKACIDELCGEYAHEIGQRFGNILKLNKQSALLKPFVNINVSDFVDINQIGHYSSSTSEERDNERVEGILQVVKSEKTIKQLYNGIESYQEEHGNKVREYHKKYKTKYKKKHKRDKLQSTLIPPDYFRREFTQFLINIKDDPNTIRYKGTDEAREENPESATIAMKDFLGAKGVELYKLALEEERYSKEYMNAVLNMATKDYKGKKWAERPIVVEGGPSSSGKSYAANEAVKAAVPFLKKEESSDDESNDYNNYVIFVDGGDFRSVSQMRKLAIKVCVNQGFTGIHDLHENSGILEDAKNKLLKFVLQPDNPHGTVIPETFSKVLGISKMFKKIGLCTNAKPIFCRVVGADPKRFRELVAFMASRRAWKTDWKTPIDFDMNSTNSLPESKKYDKIGFDAGELGTDRAERKFKKMVGKDYIIMPVVNDLMLVKEISPNEWVDASSHDKEVIKVSARLYHQWKEDQENKSTEEKRGLLAYIHENTLPAQIYLSSAVKLNNAISTLSKHLEEYLDTPLKGIVAHLKNLQLQLEEKKYRTVRKMISPILEDMDKILKEDVSRHPRGVIDALVKIKSAMMKVRTQMSFDEEAESLPSLTKLASLCTGKRKQYLDGFITEINNEPFNQWYDHLEIASLAVQQYMKEGDFSLNARHVLSRVLKNCSSIGELLNNSKVIDKKTGKIVNESILVLVEMLTIEARAMAPHIAALPISSVTAAQLDTALNVGECLPNQTDKRSSTRLFFGRSRSSSSSQEGETDKKPKPK